MKANLKKLVGLAALAMTLLATTVPTWAGYVSTSEVFIVNDPNNNQVSAEGTMVGARYSADNEQNIGCIAHTLSSYSWTTCFATDSANQKLTCGSGDEKFLETLQAMTDSSRISFTVGREGNCSHIDVYHGSDKLK
jgi:hypothetical protein